MLGWSGVPAAPEEVADQVLTPVRAGSLGHDLVAAARRADRLAVPVHGLEPLLGELAAGHPVLVLQNLGLDWYPQWHYAVAIGYDLEASTLTLRSGEEAGQVMTLTTFARTWQRAGQWALVVLPPDALPATADATSVLQAAAGLEQAGRHEAAAAAYAAALGRWPDSLVALIGRATLATPPGSWLAPRRRSAPRSRSIRRRPRPGTIWRTCWPRKVIWAKRRQLPSARLISAAVTRRCIAPRSRRSVRRSDELPPVLA